MEVVKAMKAKKLLALTLVMVMFGTTAAFADDVAAWYKAKTVKVKVNGEMLKTDGLLVNVGDASKTYLPLRDIANTLQAVVKWEDGKPVEIYKPNVHISFLTQRKDYLGLFGKVHPTKEKYNFRVQVDIDSMLTDLYGLKVEIVDPYGNVVVEEERKISASTSDVMWVQVPVTMQVDYTGKYMVKVYMKTEEKGEYFIVSEKALLSEQEK